MSLTKTTATTLRLLLHVKPNARDSSITEVGDAAISMRIAAAPREGEANTEVVKFVAKVLGKRKGDVTVVRGTKGRDKVVEVAGVGEGVEGVREKLLKAMEKD